MYLSGLFCYPVKSCAGIPLSVARLGSTGLAWDRSFMVVRPGGRFLTQRELPALALVRPALADGVMTLRVPGRDPWSVDLTERHGDPLPVVVWDDEVAALDQGDEVADLLSVFLGESVRLVRVDGPRSVDTQYAPKGAQVAFADGYPLLLATESSLADLNRRLPVALPMNRFRPNLVITGSEPFAEDGWRRLRAGEVALDVVKPCARCTITTVDQATGRRDGGEPLRTLGTFRRGARGVEFGVNAVHQGWGELRVGDLVTVLPAS